MTSARPLRLGVLASGSGSNLQALLDACARGQRDASDPAALNAEVAVVICNIEGARCMKRAAEAGVPAILLKHSGAPSREEYDARLVATLQRHEVELVCLAGFMRLVTPVLLRAYPDRVLNIHPSLLPSFRGLHAVQQALDAGARIAGCTVHFVDEGTDTGPVLIQAAVPVLDGDTEETLSQRIHAQEHACYVRAVQLIAGGLVDWTNGSAKRRTTVRLSAGLPSESSSRLVWPPLAERRAGGIA